MHASRPRYPSLVNLVYRKRAKVGCRVTISVSLTPAFGRTRPAPSALWVGGTADTNTADDENNLCDNSRRQAILQAFQDSAGNSIDVPIADSFKVAICDLKTGLTLPGPFLEFWALRVFLDKRVC